MLNWGRGIQAPSDIQALSDICAPSAVEGLFCRQGNCSTVQIDSIRRKNGDACVASTVATLVVSDTGLLVLCAAGLPIGPMKSVGWRIVWKHTPTLTWWWIL